MDWIRQFGKHIRLWWQSGLQPTSSYPLSFGNNDVEPQQAEKPEYLPEEATSEPFVRPFTEEFLPPAATSVLIEIMPAANEAHIIAWRVLVNEELEQQQPDGATIAKACMITYKELRSIYDEEDDDYGL
jgi:hypothetical protein